MDKIAKCSVEFIAVVKHIREDFTNEMIVAELERGSEELLREAFEDNYIDIGTIRIEWNINANDK